MFGLRVVVAGWLVLAACGGGGGTNATLTVQPPSAIATASGDSITFHATVSGDAGAPVWTLCCSGNDGSVSPASGMTTVYTPPERVDADTSVKLVAQSNELQFEVSITVQPAPAATVSGRVVNDLFQPVPDALVVIPGAGSTTTDANGSFTIPGVRAPYDLLVRAYDTIVVEYLRLRRLDPTAWVDVPGLMTPPAVGVSGQVSGGYIGTPGYRTIVGFGSPEVLTSYPEVGSLDGWVEADGMGAYEVGVPLVASATETTGTVYALEYRADSTGRPVEYTGFATRSVPTLLAGMGVDGQDMTLAAPPAGTAHLTGTASFGNPEALLRAKARFGHARLPILSAGATSSFDIATPAWADEVQVSVGFGDPTIVNGYYAFGYRNGLAPGASGVAVAYSGPPNPWLPADGSVLSDPDTRFQWQVGGGSPLYIATFAGGDLTLSIVTRDSSVQIPDISLLDLPSPVSNTQFIWWVTGTTGVTSTDDAAGPEGYLAGGDDYFRARSIVSSFRVP